MPGSLLPTGATPIADATAPRWLVAMQARVAALAAASPHPAGWLLLHADCCAAFRDALPEGDPLGPAMRAAADRARAQAAAQSGQRIAPGSTESRPSLAVLAEPVTMGEMARLLAIAWLSNAAADTVAGALTAKKGSKKAFKVLPLDAEKAAAPPTPAAAAEPDKATQATHGLVARIEAAASMDALKAVTMDPTVMQQRKWLSGKRPELAGLVDGAVVAALGRLDPPDMPEAADDGWPGPA